MGPQIQKYEQVRFDLLLWDGGTCGLDVWGWDGEDFQGDYVIIIYMARTTGWTTREWHSWGLIMCESLISVPEKYDTRPTSSTFIVTSAISSGYCVSDACWGVPHEMILYLSMVFTERTFFFSSGDIHLNIWWLFSKLSWTNRRINHSINTVSKILFLKIPQLNTKILCSCYKTPLSV